MMRAVLRTLSALAVALPCWVPAVYAADADGFESSGHAWEFEAIPYLWMAGVRADIEIGKFPPLPIDESFSEILDHLSGVFMARFEAQSGHGGLIADLFYVDISFPFNVDTVDIDFDETLAFGTFVANYRPFGDDKSYLDLLGGIRAWHFETQVVDKAAGIDAVLLKDNWLDPIIGARGRASFTDRFFGTAYGDVGGFGLGSELTWQAMATLGYQVHDNFDVSAGYRYLYFRRLTGEITNEQRISGPIIEAKVTF
jgi:hypothetical protein